MDNFASESELLAQNFLLKVSLYPSSAVPAPDSSSEMPTTLTLAERDRNFSSCQSSATANTQKTGSRSDRIYIPSLSLNPLHHNGTSVKDESGSPSPISGPPSLAESPLPSNDHQGFFAEMDYPLRSDGHGTGSSSSTDANAGEYTRVKPARNARQILPPDLSGCAESEGAEGDATNYGPEMNGAAAADDIFGSVSPGSLSSSSRPRVSSYGSDTRSFTEFKQEDLQDENEMNDGNLIVEAISTSLDPKGDAETDSYCSNLQRHSSAWTCDELPMESGDEVGHRSSCSSPHVHMSSSAIPAKRSETNGHLDIEYVDMAQWASSPLCGEDMAESSEYSLLDRPGKRKHRESGIDTGIPEDTGRRSPPQKVGRASASTREHCLSENEINEAPRVPLPCDKIHSVCSRFSSGFSLWTYSPADPQMWGEPVSDGVTVEDLPFLDELEAGNPCGILVAHDSATGDPRSRVFVVTTHPKDQGIVKFHELATSGIASKNRACRHLGTCSVDLSKMVTVDRRGSVRVHPGAGGGSAGESTETGTESVSLSVDFFCLSVVKSDGTLSDVLMYSYENLLQIANTGLGVASEAELTPIGHLSCERYAGLQDLSRVGIAVVEGGVWFVGGYRDRQRVTGWRDAAQPSPSAGATDATWFYVLGTKSLLAGVPLPEPRYHAEVVCSRSKKRNDASGEWGRVFVSGGKTKSGSDAKLSLCLGQQHWPRMKNPSRVIAGGTTMTRRLGGARSSDIISAPPSPTPPRSSGVAWTSLPDPEGLAKSNFSLLAGESMLYVLKRPKRNTASQKSRAKLDFLEFLPLDHDLNREDRAGSRKWLRGPNFAERGLIADFAVVVLGE